MSTMYLFNAANTHEIVTWVLAKAGDISCFEKVLEDTKKELYNDCNHLRQLRTLPTMNRLWCNQIKQLIEFIQLFRKRLREEKNIRESYWNSTSLTAKELLHLAGEVDEAIFDRVDRSKYMYTPTVDEQPVFIEPQQQEPDEVMSLPADGNIIASAISSILQRPQKSEKQEADNLEYLMKNLEIQEVEDNSESKEKELARDEIMKHMIYGKEHFNN